MSHIGQQLELRQDEPIDTAELAMPTPSRYHVRYPGVYTWYVFISSLDVMFTWVLLHFGGEEVNQIANYVLHRWDLPGLVVFKFVLVMFVICVCEYVGRTRPKMGQYLGEWAVGITCIPVLLAILQLLFTRPLH